MYLQNIAVRLKFSVHVLCKFWSYWSPCNHDLHGYRGACCWITRPLLHRDDDSVLAKLFWGGTRSLGYLLVPLGCDYLFLRYHYQVLSPPSVGALMWMFTSFKVSLSSAKPTQQLTQYPLVKCGLDSWTLDSQTRTWNENALFPADLEPTINT